MVVARSDGHKAAAISALFLSLFGPARPDYADVCSRLGDDLPEVREGLMEYLPAYAGDDACFGEAEWALLHSDMYACSGGSFGTVLDGLWIKPN